MLCEVYSCGRCIRTLLLTPTGDLVRPRPSILPRPPNQTKLAAPQNHIFSQPLRHLLVFDATRWRNEVQKFD